MKNVLLLVHDDAGQEARLQCALDLTRAIEGHLACVDVAIMPRFMDDYVSSGGEGVLIAQEEAREARNRYRLEQRLTAEDVPWHWADGEGAIADSLREIRTICYCGAKATMVVRKDEQGRVITEGSQVSIEKSIYVSLCRKHWEEETGRWPALGPAQ